MALRVYQYGIEVLLSDPTGSIYEPEIEDVIDFDETINADFPVVVDEELAIDEEVLTNAEYDVEVEDVLDFDETVVTPTIYNVEIEDEIGIEESMDGHEAVVRRTISDILQLIENTSAHQAVRNLLVAQEIGFLERVYRQIDATIDDPIAFISEVFRIITVEQELAIDHDVQVSVGKPLRQFLNIVQSVTRQLLANRTLTDPVSIGQAVVVLHLTAGILCNYAPQGDLPAEPTLTPSQFTLFFPPELPTTTLALPNPELGDRTSYLPNRISRKSRGGTKQVFRDNTWPSTTSLNIDVGSLTNDQRDDLLDFLRLTLGQLVGLMDYEGRMWVGIIMNPNAEFTTLSEKGCGAHATTLVFDGSLV